MLVIETLIDFEALSIEEVTQRIKSVQDREEAPHAEPSTARGKLLYTTEQWRAFDKKKMEEGSSLSGSKEHRRRPRGGKEEKGPMGRSALMAAPPASIRRHGGQAHVAQSEDQDATLFLAHGCVEL